MVLACLKCSGRLYGDPACLWIARLAGFKGTVLVQIMQACAGMRDAAQWRSWRAVQA
jgi:hypothetical protein